MTDLSRRHFLRNAGIGVAAAGAIAAAPGLAASAAGAAGAESAHPSSAQDAAGAADGTGNSVTAHVVDAAAGTIALYVGTQEVVIHNRRLANELVRAAQ